MTLTMYGATEVKRENWARIGLLGAPKQGKTTALLKTCPKPIFLINCDGKSGTVGAVNQGAVEGWTGVDVESIADWQEACNLAIKLVKEGQAKTIIVDTVSRLSLTILDDLRQRKVPPKGYDLWNELRDQIMYGVQGLLKLPAHVFITSHLSPADDTQAGILPVIKGAAKNELTQIIDDWILFEADSSKKPVERSFLVGPQKTWSWSGRNVKRECVIPADVEKLFAELGFSY